MTYMEKLRDPRWQKKRLHILERDNWCCKACGATDKNLQVHHLFYAKRDPWDYPNDAYQTLCDSCHLFRQRLIDSSIEKFRVGIASVPNDVLESYLDDRLLLKRRTIASGVPLNIYLAGKISKNCWRHEIVSGLREAEPLGLCQHGTDGEFPKVLTKSIFGYHNYVGPFFVSCDHGCFHGDNSHGSGAIESSESRNVSRQQVKNRALEGIRKCDVLFALINSNDCYGTLFEIGYATAIGKDVIVAVDGRFPDLWFSIDAGAASFPLDKGDGSKRTMSDFVKHFIGGGGL